ncbi:MAG: hypothetical protein SFV32_12675 [Opitutaceae bacterium]|nr:hypothetical protein [Opitutaceae bacterium]
MKTMDEAWKQGHVFRADSERFGVNDLLCINSPGSCPEERYLAAVIKPDGTLRQTLYLSSYAKDKVLHEYGTLADYFAQQPRAEQGSEVRHG